MKRKIYVFMAVLSGLVFGLSVYYYLQINKAAPLTETKPLVIAAVDIPARSIIQESQLMVKNIPLEGYPQGGASSISAVAGNVLLVNLKKNDVILNPMFQTIPSADTGAGVSSDSYSLAVPKGQRAVAIPVGQAGSVNYKVKPGDRVDILITMDIEPQDGKSITITSLAAQDVLVLNTGDNACTDSSQSSTSCSYILALSVPQAMAVTLGSERGSVRLILRNPVNKEIYPEKPIDPSIYLSPDYFNHYK